MSLEDYMNSCSTAAGRATHAYCNSLQELFVSGSSRTNYEDYIPVYRALPNPKNCLKADALTCSINEADNRHGANRCRSTCDC